MSRVPRLLRMMHTPGRQVPHPPQGGAGQMPTTSPTPHSSSTPPPPPALTSDPAIEPSTPDALVPALLPVTPEVKRYNRRGQRIPSRPARTVPVQLPSGHLEPPTYPPPDSYYQQLAEQTQPKHKLWKFFHVSTAAQKILDRDAKGPGDAGTIELSTDRDIRAGRAWLASELRLKSFYDLHTLWYILLRERNVLYTQQEERKRLRVEFADGGDHLAERKKRVRQSMARIKLVLNERRLGLIAAASPLLPERQDMPAWADPRGEQKAMEGRAAVDMNVWNESRGLRRLRERAGLGEQQAEGEGEGVFEEESGVGREGEAAVPEAEVAKEEVESRDEGFGGGKEAERFNEDMDAREKK